MRFLLLDDQRSARVVLKRLLEDRPDIEVVEAASADEARLRVETQEIDAMLLDIRLSDAPSDRGGLDFLRWVRGTGRSMPAVMVTGVSELAEIREAMRQGAQDYVLKDELCAEMILPIVDGIRERFALRDEVQRLREQVDRRQGLPAIVGASAAIERVRKLVRRVADADAPILVRGATGSGKEMVTRAIHYAGKRASQPLLAVNCSALPGTLIESLVFGHQRGAFTGADRRVRGQLELAGAGTLMLDEIAEMPIELQAKLLRVLEDRKFRPLGAEEELTLEARIVAATNVDLERRIADGTFREDLYFRLNVVTIDVPPLSERDDDIPHLMQSFVSDLPRALRFTDQAVSWLRARHWAGNVRELRNAIERLSLLAENDLIDVATLEELVGSDGVLVERELTRLAKTLLALTTKEPSKLDAIQRAVVEQALVSAKGNKSAAARLLGIHRKMLERMVKPDTPSDLPPDSEP
jgi:DNA-binding NtrC family response regulator